MTIKPEVMHGIPETTTLLLLGIGLAGSGFSRRRNQSFNTINISLSGGDHNEEDHSGDAEYISSRRGVLC